VKVVDRIIALLQRADMADEPQAGRTLFIGKDEAEALKGEGADAAWFTKLVDGPPGTCVFFMGCQMQVDRNLHGVVLEVKPPPPPVRRYT
jgi:hypothetical protein